MKNTEKVDRKTIGMIWIGFLIMLFFMLVFYALGYNRGVTDGSNLQASFDETANAIQKMVPDETELYHQIQSGECTCDANGLIVCGEIVTRDSLTQKMTKQNCQLIKWKTIQTMVTP